MGIEFDPAKNAANLVKHGIDMADAAAVFAGVVLTAQDTRQNYGEPRFLSYGRLDGRLVIIAWTPRPDARRVISMRKCNDRENKAFGQFV